MSPGFTIHIWFEVLSGDVVLGFFVPNVHEKLTCSCKPYQMGMTPQSQRLTLKAVGNEALIRPTSYKLGTLIKTGELLRNLGFS